MEEEKTIIPSIFEGRGNPPPGFNAVTIYLDGRVQADLDWKVAKEQAQQAVEKGYLLVWDINLFANLPHPLIHQGQFLSLTLSLEHFRDSLWQEFKSHTLGIVLFRGSIDFSQNFPWDHHQKQNFKEWLQENFTESSEQLVRLFCRDVVIEYLALLVSRLPDALAAYLYLDATCLANSYAYALQLLNPERFNRFTLAIKGHFLPFTALGWQTATVHGYSHSAVLPMPASSSVTIGVCIPSDYHLIRYQELEKGLLLLQQKNIPFKLIGEDQLTSQWDGLDYLFYSPSRLSDQGKRKLQGFCAAGGTAVSTGALLGFSYEIALMDFKPE